MSDISPLASRRETYCQGFSTDGSFIPWAADLRRYLLETYDYPDGLSPIPDDALLQPKWTLEIAHDSGNATSSRHSSQGDVPAHKFETKEDGIQNEFPLNSRPPSKKTQQADLPPNNLLPIPGAITVTLDKNDRVTPMDHWQDVRQLKFSAPISIDYGPGDVLTIFPKNFPQDVEDLISIMNWGHIADTPLRYVRTTSSAENHDDPPPVPYLLPTPELTLRNLLTHYLDITAIPRRSFFSLIAHFTNDPVHKDRLLEFTKPQYLDELYDYTTRPRRSILEVLHDFRSVKIPWRWVGSVIPVLKGRQFSIASGGSMKRTKTEPYLSKFDLLVAIVKYRTVIKKVRQGVCSRYLSSLPEGTKLNVLLRRGGLNLSRSEARRPVIMVAPGTGVAPMRSLIWERLSWKEEESRRQDLTHVNGLASSNSGIGDNVLFFGCRNKESDFFFQEEWEELKSKLGLQVYTAFSRDQVSRIPLFCQV